VSIDWERCESGPADADRSVLLLPGGLNRARSYEELMAQPALADVRLVAATLPGHGGTPPPDDFSIEHAARLATELAVEINCDVVVGFSMGASVALEMAASGAFAGPVVLLGISLSPKDEPVFLRVLDRLGVVLGSLPFAAMRQMMGSVTKNVRVSEARRAELLDDLRRNDPAVMRRLFRGYLQYLGRDDSPAARLCDAGVPAWIVHAEKGDGGLTDDERRTLDACPSISVITIPGTSFFLPNEETERIAELVVDALSRSSSR
jgi:pimeloyl-ACP methyl ester carboxylesterase